MKISTLKQFKYDNKQVVSFLSALLILFLFFLPSLVLAQTEQAGENGLAPTCGFDCDFNDFMEAFNEVLTFLIFTIAMPAAVIAIVIGGLYYMFNLGNDSHISQAKKIITAGVVGLIIALAAWLIVKVIVLTLVGSEEGNALQNALRALFN